MQKVERQELDEAFRHLGFDPRGLSSENKKGLKPKAERSAHKETGSRDTEKAEIAKREFSKSDLFKPNQRKAQSQKPLQKTDRTPTGRKQMRG